CHAANRVFLCLAIISISPPDRTSQRHFFADGLRISEVRYSRAWLVRSRRKTRQYQRDHDYHSRADYRRADTKVCSVSDGRDRWSDLRRRSIHHGVADGLVRVCRQRRDGTMAGAQLPWATGKHSPLLRHDCALSDRVLGRRSVLFTARVRVCRCNCTARTGSFIWLARVSSIPRGQISSRIWRLATREVLSGTRPAT